MTEQRQDESELWNAFGDGAPYLWPREAGFALGIHPKRVDYLCLKWAKQRRYDYGVSVNLGWKKER